MDHCIVLICLALCAIWHAGPTLGQSQIDMNVLDRLESLEKQVSSQQNQLEVQNWLIADLQTRVTDQELAIAKQQTTINEQQTTIVDQQKTISEQQKTILEQQDAISKQQTAQSEQHRRLTLLEGILMASKTNKGNRTGPKMAAKTSNGNWTVTPMAVEEDLSDQHDGISGVVHQEHTEQDNADGNHAKLQDRKTTNLNKRFVLENGGPIAFHAILKATGPHGHAGLGQKIMFPTVMLNLGAGYHNQHGIFIAPAAGIYIFSTSILMYNHPSFIDVSMMKNGVVLARAAADADTGVNDQGSVTVVTQLAVGDEVWVSVYNPADAMYWGTLSQALRASCFGRCNFNLFTDLSMHQIQSCTSVLQKVMLWHL